MDQVEVERCQVGSRGVDIQLTTGCLLGEELDNRSGGNAQDRRNRPAELVVGVACVEDEVGLEPCGKIVFRTFRSCLPDLGNGWAAADGKGGKSADENLREWSS